MASVFLLLIAVKSSKAQTWQGSYFEATDKNQFRGGKIICDNGRDCTVVCDEEGACLNADIICPIDASCDITCGRDYGCMYANITCSHTQTCSVTCGGWSTTDNSYACADTDIEWPEDPALATLTCIGGFQACDGVEWPEFDQYLPLEVDCVAEMCQEREVRCPAHASCSVNCGQLVSCFKTKIICPACHPCTVKCDHDSACFRAKVEWSDEESLSTLICNDNDYCPGKTTTDWESNWEINEWEPPANGSLCTSAPTGSPTSSPTISPTSFTTPSPTPSPTTPRPTTSPTTAIMAVSTQSQTGASSCLFLHGCLCIVAFRMIWM